MLNAFPLTRRRISRTDYDEKEVEAPHYQNPHLDHSPYHTSR